MATSYNNWPASPDAASIGIDRNYSVLGTKPFANGGYAGGMKAGPVSTVFTYLITRLHNEVEPMMTEPGTGKLGYGCWGYNYRPNVNNPSVLSCHASGTAIDYNAPRHPNQTKTGPNGGGGWTAKQYAQVQGILRELSGVIRWLTSNDPMHFEIQGSAAQVATAAAKLKLPTVGPGDPPVEPIKPPVVIEEDDDMLKVVRNDKGVDYLFGPSYFRRIATVDEYKFHQARGWIPQSIPHGSAPVVGQNLIDDTENHVRINQLAPLTDPRIQSLVNGQTYSITDMIRFIDLNAHGGPDPAPPVSTYTVVAGDTFTGIAAKLNVTPDALAAANPQVTNRDNIDIGQVLTIPK